MHIDLNSRGTALPNFWNHIHFHPTDAIEDDWGRRILDRVSADGAARTVRMYSMFEDIVTMDAQGQLQFDFSLNDQRMDYMLEKGFQLMVCYNFMPPCLARDTSLTSAMAKNKTRYKGKMIITSPPTDYALWEEICYRYTAHLLERYGEDRVKTWYLQCYNEPDIPQFFMGDLDRSVESTYQRLTEYCRLYDAFSAGVCRASQNLKLGGPTLAHNQMFFGGFLQHIKQSEGRLDFVCVHSYGTGPSLLNKGIKPFCVDNNIRKIRMLKDMVREHPLSVPEFVVDEWGAATSGFFNMEECPKLLFRETTGLACYFGKLVTRMLEQDVTVDRMLICLSGQHEMVVDFSGFRNLFTLNHIRKPIYNAYVLLSRLGDRLLKAESDGDVSVLATGCGQGAAIALTYSAEHFDRELPDLAYTLTLEGVTGPRTATLWCIDRDHCDPYGMYLRQGMTDPLTDEQIRQLREEGELKVAETVTLQPDENGTAQLTVTLKNNSLVLVQL